MKSRLLLFLLLIASVFILASHFLIGTTQYAASAQESPLATPSSEEERLALVAKADQVALVWTADHAGITSDTLKVVYREIIPFAMTEKQIIAISVIEDGISNIFPQTVYVDMQSMEVVEDPTILYQNERDSFAQKYGKIAPDLFNRLQNGEGMEPTQVAIWIATPNMATIEETLRAEADELHPEPTRPEADDEIAHKAYVEWSERWIFVYIAGLTKAMEEVTAPLQAILKADGIEAEVVEGMPLILTSLTAEQIHNVALHDDIDTVYAADEVGKSALDSAMPSGKVSQAWARSAYSIPLNGNGVTIAILERSHINGAATNCLTINPVRPIPPTPTLAPGIPTPTPSPHKNIVAAAASCNNAVLRGPAYESRIVDAGHNSTQADTIEALKWAILTPVAPRPVNIVNQSEYYEVDRQIRLMDRVYDYWVFQKRMTAIIAAGNLGAGTGNVTTPGKAYNVITVGNMDNLNTALWSDDLMSASSSWVNPLSEAVGGSEKPEIVAPGTNINTVAGQRSGTSFSAPQVTGVVALLMQRSPTLMSWPSAVKAILMASAVHNVHGETLSNNSSLDERDGAGAIDAALADTIAQNHAGSNTSCTRSCYWTLETGGPTGGGSYLNYTIRAIEGEQVRIAVSWLAKAASDYSTGGMQSNYDLYVNNINNVVITSSVSLLNNYEVVEFTAPYTGQYNIVLHRTHNAWGLPDWDYQNYLSMAWSKQALYAPDIRKDGAWTSNLYMRNEEPTFRHTDVSWMNASGSHFLAASHWLTPRGLMEQAAPGTLQQGSAVLNGHEDVSGVYGMTANGGGLATLDNFFRPPEYGDPAFERANTVLFAPALYKNIYDTLPSTIEIQNVGAVGTQPTIYFKGRTGVDFTAYPGTTPLIPPGGRYRLDLATMGPSSWIGSAMIIADQPLTGRVIERDTLGRYTRSYNLGATGYPLVYSPVVYRKIWNYSSGLIVQHVGGSAPVNVDVIFRNLNGTEATRIAISNLAQFRAAGINLDTLPDSGPGSLPASWQGSVVIQSSDLTTQLLLIVSNTKTVGTTIVGSFSSAGVGHVHGGRVVVLPYIVRNWNGRITGYLIRNISGASNTVTARYYDMAGNLTGSATLGPIPSGGMLNRTQLTDSVITDGWRGSVVLEATGPIVAVVREEGNDTVAGYNGMVFSP